MDIAADVVGYIIENDMITNKNEQALFTHPPDVQMKFAKKAAAVSCT